MSLKTIARLAAVALLSVCTACGPALATSVSSTPVQEPIVTAATLPTEAASPASATPSSPSTSTPSESPSPSPEAPLAALVNGQPIYLADYERELGRYEADLPARGIDPSSAEGQADLAEARTWILEWMITEVLIEQAATEASIVVSDEDVDASMQEMVTENGGEESFRAKLEERGETYEEAWQKVRSGLIVAAMNQYISEAVPTVTEHIHARHILVDTAEEAERIHAQLEAGADFAALAKAYSQDPNTRETGGDLGFFGTQPFMPYGRLEAWKKHLLFFEASDFETFVPGHGRIGTKEDLALQRRYFEVLEQQVSAVIQAGGTPEEALKIELPAPFDTWLAGGMGRFEANINYMYAKLSEET